MVDASVPPVVRLGAACRALLEEAWSRAGGREPCGYLLGGQQVEGSLSIVSVLRGENVHPTPASAWALAPGTQLRVRRAARARGQRVIGYWHGHLLGAARPGRRDHADRDLLGRDLHIILGQDAGRQFELRAWRAGPSGFEPLTISAPASSR